MQKDKFEQEALEAHNAYRAKHGAPELTWNRELCDIAQKWADHLAAEKAFEHSKTNDRTCSKGTTGENLFYSGSTGELEINGVAAVDSWYNEIKDYDFEKPGFAMNTGNAFVALLPPWIQYKLFVNFSDIHYFVMSTFLDFSTSTVIRKIILECN